MLMWLKNKRSKSCDISSNKSKNPHHGGSTFMIPSKPNYLPKTPNTTTPRLKAQKIYFGEKKYPICNAPKNV